MPFVINNEDCQFDEDGDLIPPSADDFIYLAPPEFSGASVPVRFEEVFDGAAETMTAPPSLIRWGISLVFGKRPVQDNRSCKLMGLCCPAFRRLGGLRVRCAYDGGNDEGFAWIVGLETESEILSFEELVDRLIQAGFAQVLSEAGYLQNQTSNLSGRVIDVLKYELADEWAILLLGQGYGTGEYSMYGAFSVDLQKRTILDDRHARPPEGGNFEIRS